ncbi:hypothetical protein OC846_006669 [Tilletia horrida]|uniref:Uncharacterized protein n=1 Tax=Tilletia horrida TaxID=155126 RepID=A0AAN6GIF2_9BASI|nr:hypothetical protein OC846_006669 [Tilletia horrida]
MEDAMGATTSKEIAPQPTMTTFSLQSRTTPQEVAAATTFRRSHSRAPVTAQLVHRSSSLNAAVAQSFAEDHRNTPTHLSKETFATRSSHDPSPVIRRQEYKTPTHKQTRTSSAYKRIGDAPTKANVKKQRTSEHCDNLSTAAAKALERYESDPQAMETPCRGPRHEGDFRRPDKYVLPQPRTSWPMDSDEDHSDLSSDAHVSAGLPAYTEMDPRVPTTQDPEASILSARFGNSVARPSASSSQTCIKGIPPNLEATALRMREYNMASVEALRDWSDYMRAVRDILPKTKYSCPMCSMLSKPAGHAPGRCQTEHLNIQAQIQFRNDKDNKWDYGQACYFCWLPQDVCRRRNDAKECSMQPYKEAVRGILMMLTAYPAIRAAAVEVATLFNPLYSLPEPVGPLSMGRDWRDNEYRYGSPTYTSFQALAAILFLWDGRI